MSSSLAIEHVETQDLSPEEATAVVVLCDAAYGCATQPMFDELGAGHHLLGRSDGVLVSHLMWITRWLQPAGLAPLRTAYIEMVATHPTHHGRGHASRLLEHLVPYAADYEVAALSPATEGLYRRLGWRLWEGPLFTRKDGHAVPTPYERVMVLVGPHSPDLDFRVALSVEWRPGEVW
jgi:aminoglycoside 2'-N-acetyltransferase I